MKKSTVCKVALASAICAGVSIIPLEAEGLYGFADLAKYSAVGLLVGWLVLCCFYPNDVNEQWAALRKNWDGEREVLTIEERFPTKAEAAAFAAKMNRFPEKAGVSYSVKQIA